MNAGERSDGLERFAPINLLAKVGQRFRLSILQNRKRFDDLKTEGFEELRLLLARRREHVAHEFAVMRALLDDDEVVGVPKAFPDFSELGGKQLAKQWADAHVREIIAASPDRGPVAGIISVLGVAKRVLHEAGECDGAGSPDFL